MANPSFNPLSSEDRPMELTNVAAPKSSRITSKCTVPLLSISLMLPLPVAGQFVEKQTPRPSSLGPSFRLFRITPVDDHDVPSVFETIHAEAVTPPTLTDWPLLPAESAVAKVIVVAFAAKDPTRRATVANELMTLNMAFLQ